MQYRLKKKQDENIFHNSFSFLSFFLGKPNMEIEEIKLICACTGILCGAWICTMYSYWGFRIHSIELVVMFSGIIAGSLFTLSLSHCFSSSKNEISYFLRQNT